MDQVGQNKCIIVWIVINYWCFFQLKSDYTHINIIECNSRFITCQKS